MPRLIAVPAAALVLGLAASALLLSAPVAAADGLPALTLSKTVVKPGESFTVSGAGCLPDDETDDVQVLVSFTGVESTTPAPDGTWSVTTTVSSTITGGRLSRSVQASCRHTPSGFADYPSAPITVDAPLNWWQTCGPLPGNPGVTGCPGPPPSGHINPPVAQPTPTTAPRTTAAVRTTAVPPPTTSAAPTTSLAADVAPTPATGCRDCARLTGGAPVAPGARLALSYAGFHPGERVSAVLHSTPVDLGTFTADASGVLAAPVTVPAWLEAGAHTLVLTGAATGDRVVHFRLTAAPRATAAAAASAQGGMGTAVPVILGVVGAVGLLGGVGVLVVRRRRAAAIG